jgi:hypothetical protein
MKTGAQDAGNLPPKAPKLVLCVPLLALASTVHLRPLVGAPCSSLRSALTAESNVVFFYPFVAEAY